jgi:hypothetical protein
MEYNSPLEIDRMAENNTSTPVNAREAIASIKGPMSNEELMKRFKITPLGFTDLLRQLLKHKLISEADLERRGIHVTYRKKQAQAREARYAPQMVASISYEEDEGFLDTVTLTDILTFKPEAEPPRKKEPIEKPRQPEKEKPDEPEKKSRFRITGFFKKPR